jgi:hypothetical protein
MCFTTAVQATMRCWRGGEYVSTCEGVIWDLGGVRHYRGGGVGWGGDIVRASFECLV